jgi:hypothetical protein
MTKTERFFFDNAGYSYDPRTETRKQGRLRCARALALAEETAAERNWEFLWDADQDGCIGCDCGAEDCKCCTGEPHEILCCALKDADGKILASMGGICEPTRDYGRIVEAELASEALSTPLTSQ